MKIYQRILRRAVVLGLVVGLPQSALAEAITLEQALERAEAANPVLATARSEQAGRAAAANAFTRYQNPELNVELEDFLGSGPYTGVNSAEATLQLNQPIAIGSQARGKRASVNANVLVAQAELQAAHAELRAQVYNRAYELANAQARLALAQDVAAAQKQMLTDIQRRVEAGRLSAAELARARVALAHAERDLSDRTSEIDTLRFALAALWNSDIPDFDTVNATLQYDSPLPTTDALYKLLDSAPGFLLWQARIESAQAELAIEKGQNLQTVDMGLGYRQHLATRDGALTAGLTLPLPIGKTNASGVASAKASLAQAQARLTMSRKDFERQLFTHVRAMQRCRANIATQQAEARPAALEALTGIRAGYELGRYSYIDLQDARTALLQIDGSIIGLWHELHLAATAIEQILGTTIFERPNGAIRR